MIPASQPATSQTGPGAGRPAKLYRRSEREVGVSVPARQYELAGQLLADGVEESDSTGEPVRAVLFRKAAELGERLDTGYEACLAPAPGRCRVVLEPAS